MEKPWSIKVREADSQVKPIARQERKFQPISHIRKESEEQSFVEQEKYSQEKELNNNAVGEYSSNRMGLPPAQYNTNTHEKEFQTKESA